MYVYRVFRDNLPSDYYDLSGENIDTEKFLKRNSLNDSIFVMFPEAEAE